MKIDPSSIFVVVPGFNEGSVIAQTIQPLLDKEYSVVFTDDGSTDNTSQVLKDMNIYYLRHPVNLGQGAALQTAMKYCLQISKAKFVVHFDADGQHAVSDIEHSVKAMIEGEFDIVLGSRFLKKEDKLKVPIIRRMILYLGRVINWLFYGLWLSDSHNGFRVLSREALKKINLHENGSAHASEILGQIKKEKLRYKEVSITIIYTAYSIGKGQSSWAAFNIFIDLILRKLL